MATSLKKVILRKWTQEWISGYLPAQSFVKGGAVELLELGGKVQPVPLTEVKWVCFVRDFNSGEIANPERLLRKTFAGRPRSAGLWVRLKLKDGDLLEGLADNDSTLIAFSGLLLTPPDTRSNTQRMFLPSASIVEMQVLSVIGISAKAIGADKPAKGGDNQPRLFEKA